MKNGDKVIVGGSVNVYERDGKYQLYAKEITLEGAGLLYERYLALKRELEEMGMFAQDYKQPIPKHIRTLGVVHPGLPCRISGMWPAEEIPMCRSFSTLPLYREKVRRRAL